MTSRATLAKQPSEVARMFDGVARRYDLTNSVLSFGLDRYWRSQTRLLLGAEDGETILDLAAGTGVSTAQLSGNGARAIACDFSLGMLRAGRRRRPRVTFVAGDATRLPFADNSVDGATISFGLRNVVDVPGALRELARVVKPDGRLVICEFSHPTFAPFRYVYVEYLMRALPRIAAKVSSNADAYVYLAESIRAWPGQRELTELIRANGWDHVAYRNLTGGIVALHVASQPEAASPSLTARPPEA